MKIVFPTDENMGFLSRRGAHFGKAKFYTLITVENDRITEVEGVVNPGHDAGGCGNAVANIMALRPDALVVTGIGGSPAKGFEQAGLKVYVDQESPTVKHSVERLVGQTLNTLNGNGTCSVH